MSLATTALKEFWDTRSKILLLGPWCVRFEDPDWLAGFDHEMLPNIWDDRARLESGARTCRDIQPALMGELAAYLNSVHGTGFGPRYWNALSGLWLLYYTHQLFDRYSQIRAALDAHPAESSIGLDRRDFLTPLDSADFLRMYHTDRFNLQMYTHILEFLGKDVPAKRLERTETAEPPRSGPGGGLLGRAKRGTKTLALRALSSSLEAGLRGRGPAIVCDDLYPMRKKGLLRLTARMKGRLLPLLGTFPKNLRVPARMDGRRLGLADLDGRDEFQKLLIASLPWALPAILLEGFAGARRRCPARKGGVPRAVFSSTGLFYNDYFKFAAAEWIERGAEAWGRQHGGQYGTIKYSLAEWHERDFCDKYFTWGWSSVDGDSRLRDLPPSGLSETAGALKNARPGGGEGVLLLTLENVKNAHHLAPHPMGRQWEEFFDWQERFIAALGERAGILRVRLYPHDYGWRQEARLKEKFPGIAFDPPGTPFLESLRRTRLAVTNYPGTPMYEALAADKPSIHFWKPQHWELRPEAEDCFAGLRRAGIVHDSPESAARRLLDIYDDPSGWWDLERTQAARAGFMNRYARVDDDWLGAWTRTLGRELDSAGARTG